MDSKKIIFLVPHLSTGGMPQYVVWLVEELLKKEQNVYVIEFSDIAPIYVVQKNKIKNLIGNNLITLYGNDEEKHKLLIELLNKIEPDILHLQEFPEMWLPDFISKDIYKKNGSFRIIETSHDSGFDPKNKRYFPDGFSFISNFHPPLYSNLNIPYDIVEYPIIKKDRPDRDSSLIKLGLDPSYIHILNVGLFTPRKNQAEIFIMANRLKQYKIKFHFVGNQADNFRFYWEPLMRDKPDNCIVWGERSDADSFYSCMDLFLFTSHGTTNDRETNPLVLKEAMGWQMPVMMYNLPVYCGMYDSFNNVYFMKENIEENVSKIAKLLLNENIPINEKYDPFFDSLSFSYDADQNKIDIKCNCEVLGQKNFYVSIRELNNHIPIYSSEAVWGSYTSFWLIPIPRGFIDLKESDLFTGFLIEFYDMNKNKLYEHEIKVSGKKCNVTEKFDYLPFYDSLFINFYQFNHLNIYAEMNFEKEGTVIDIGANVGFFTDYALSKGSSRIYSVEPSPASLPLLKDRYKNNNDVVIIPKVVYNKRGNISFNTDDNNSTINKISHDEHDNSIMIECVTVQDILFDYNINHVDVLKMDVEGAEYEIFEAIPDYVFDKIDKMIIEFHFQSLFGNKLRKSILDRLDKNGFYYYMQVDSGKYVDENCDMGILFAYKIKNIPLKLNLGCGEYLLKHFINIDLHNKKADKNMNIIKLDYEDNSVDQIYSSHLLEHFGKYELPSVLKESFRVLKHGKQLIAIVPNLEGCLKLWLDFSEEDRENLGLDIIFGNQITEGEFHKTGFTKKNIKRILKESGFDSVYVNDIDSHGQPCYIVRANKL